MIKILTLVHDIFEDLELMYPVLRMDEEGIEVILAGEERDRLYKGKYGYPCKSSCRFEDLKSLDFQGMLIPGGFSPDRLRRLPCVLSLVQEMHQAEKMIAFICHGGWVPISAKILQGRKATGTLAIKDDLENAGAIWEDSPVVIDKNLISSRTPNDLPQFGKAIVQALSA